MVHNPKIGARLKSSVTHKKTTCLVGASPEKSYLTGKTPCATDIRKTSCSVSIMESETKFMICHIQHYYHKTNEVIPIARQQAKKNAAENRLRLIFLLILSGLSNIPIDSS